jgi:hypothetical protein
MNRGTSQSYSKRDRRSVFINCPFDQEYQPLFDAIVYTTHACGFVARCTLEDGNGEAVRIEKILRMIDDCELGIHDISKVKLYAGFPRFNMPFELGLFLGAQSFGSFRHRCKAYLILTEERYQHNSITSALMGKDLEAHENKPEKIVDSVSQFLLSRIAKGFKRPGRDELQRRYQEFENILPNLLEYVGQDRTSMTFKEFRGYVEDIITEQARLD